MYANIKECSILRGTEASVVQNCSYVHVMAHFSVERCLGSRKGTLKPHR